MPTTTPKRFGLDHYVKIGQAYHAAKHAGVGYGKVEQYMRQVLHPEGITATQIRYAMSHLHAMDRRVRHGTRPTKGYWKDSKRFRALFPLPTFRKRVRRNPGKRPTRKSAPVVRTVTARSVNETELVMTHRNGLVELDIKTSPAIAHRLLAVLAEE